ncbi:MAG TPA: VIT domain-containing protein, partial [Chthoniobacteraceae bacterium]
MKRNFTPIPTYGLLAWLEETRIALPLKGVECRFEVSGSVASVEIDQIYHQNAPRPVDCVYSFPLPADAAVYRCEIHINDRVVRAKVEAREEARRIYREQHAVGRRAALVETERDNLFTLSLGNVQPEDVIVVRFAWFQVIDRPGREMRLSIPTCPGIRYIPGQPLLRKSSGLGTADDTDQVPDASRISPLRIDALHPDSAYFCIDGLFSLGDIESGSVSSPSHGLYVRELEGRVKVELSRDSAVPDRDFIVTWQEAKAKTLTPRGWHWIRENETFALAQLRAPEVAPTVDAFEQDVYFLVDRSGSMQGAKWQSTCAALTAFVGLLGARDRVWITLFESGFQDFAEAPMLAMEVIRDSGFRGLADIGTGGGTELLLAANHVIERIRAHSSERRATVILITDGQVGNEKEVLRVFGGLRNVTVYTFGIDTAVNDGFLKSLARQSRGQCWLRTPNDDIPGVVAGLADRLRRPVLTDLRLAGDWQTSSETLPDLHAGEVVSVTLRGRGADAVEIGGKLADGAEHRMRVEITEKGSEAIRLVWTKDRISALLASGRREEAIGLAIQANILCEGAAFIAWDEAEKVAIATETLVQPSLEPLRAGFSSVARGRSATAAAKPIRYCFHDSDPSSKLRETETPKQSKRPMETFWELKNLVREEPRDAFASRIEGWLLRYQRALEND